MFGSTDNVNTSSDNSIDVMFLAIFIYKVGSGIHTSEYKFTQNASSVGYVERAYDSSMELDSIISNKCTSKEGQTVYVTIRSEYLKNYGW
ncbi:MAG: hypothetical protein MJ224_01760 [archaeon]|nr:hypothetical protein [archaeon]